MSEIEGIARVTRAATPMQAEILAGVLTEAGIPVYIDGRQLTDEFALSQALMNQAQVDVMVPEDRLAAARRALREAAESAKLLDDPNFDPGDPVE